MTAIKNTEGEIEAGAAAALVEAIANLDDVQSGSVADLLDSRLDAAVSSRSSHSWDPNGTIGTNLDAKVSEAGATQSDVEAAAESALAEDIANYAPAAGSVAALLNSNLDASVSSRSSHGDPDPNGYIDAAVSSRSSHPWDPDGVLPAAGSVSTHSWDPNGRIDVAISTRSSHNWDPNGRIDTAVSSRSSHNWDPNGTIGTNIDAAVSSRATPADVGARSVAWQSLTPAASGTAGSHASNTIRDISGSGFLVSVTGKNGNPVRFEIDGGTIHEQAVADSTTQMVMARFESQLTVSSSNSSATAAVVLD